MRAPDNVPKERKKRTLEVGSGTRRYWTVWEFRGVTVIQPPVIVARLAEPNDMCIQHEFQRVLWQGFAWTAAEALGLAAVSVTRIT